MGTSCIIHQVLAANAYMLVNDIAVDLCMEWHLLYLMLGASDYVL